MWNSQQLPAVNFFGRKLIVKCVAGFSIRLWMSPEWNLFALSFLSMKGTRRCLLPNRRRVVKITLSWFFNVTASFYFTLFFLVFLIFFLTTFSYFISFDNWLRLYFLLGIIHLECTQNFPKNLTFLTSWYAHFRVRIRG